MLSDLSRPPQGLFYFDFGGVIRFVEEAKLSYDAAFVIGNVKILDLHAQKRYNQICDAGI